MKIRSICSSLAVLVIAALSPVGPAEASSAPAPVSSLHATPSRSAVALSWRNPASLAGVTVRYRMGVIAPTTLTQGRPVTLSSAKATRVTVSNLAAGLPFSFAVWTHDSSRHYSAPAKITRRTAAEYLPAPSLQGTVTDHHAGAPISGVSVTATPPSGTPVRAHTGPHGSYSMSVQGGVKYTVDVDPASLTERPPGSYQSATISVTARPFRATTGLNVQLAAAGGIGGRIIDSQGKPIAGVTLYLSRLTAAEDEGRIGQPVKTGRYGYYLITGLPPTVKFMYSVCALAPELTSSPTGYEQTCDSPALTVRAGTVATVNLTMPTAAAISGTITSQAGDVPSGVRVVVNSAPRAAVSLSSRTSTVGRTAVTRSSDTTGSDGTYIVKSLLAVHGPYQVCFDGTAATGPSATGYGAQCYNDKSWDGEIPLSSDATPVPTTARSIKSGIDGRLPLGGAVTGTITAASGSAALSGVRVEIQQSGRPAFKTATTDSSGTYRVTGLIPGTEYHVCFDGSASNDGPSDAGYLSECNLDAPWNPLQNSVFPPGTPVSAASGQTVTVDAALDSAGALGGRITGPGGAGLTQVNVTVTDPHGFVRQAVTDPSYLLRGLPLGPGYRVCFDASGASGGASTTGYQAECVDATATAGAVTPAGAALQFGGAITGKVTARASGAALDNVSVVVPGQSTHGDYTGADGSFVLHGLSPTPGGYKVCFLPNSGPPPTDQPGDYQMRVTGDNSTIRFTIRCMTVTAPVAAGHTVSGVNAALVLAS